MLISNKYEYSSILFVFKGCHSLILLLLLRFSFLYKLLLGYMPPILSCRHYLILAAAIWIEVTDTAVLLYLRGNYHFWILLCQRWRYIWAALLHVRIFFIGRDWFQILGFSELHCLSAETLALKCGPPTFPSKISVGSNRPPLEAACEHKVGN